MRLLARTPLIRGHPRAIQQSLRIPFLVQTRTMLPEVIRSGPHLVPLGAMRRLAFKGLVSGSGAASDEFVQTLLMSIQIVLRAEALRPFTIEDIASERLIMAELVLSALSVSSVKSWPWDEHTCSPIDF